MSWFDVGEVAMANKKPSTLACRNLLLDDLNWTKNKNYFCTFAFAWPRKDSSHGCEGGCDPVSTDWLRCYVHSYRQPRRLLHLPPGGDQFLFFSSFSVLFFSSRIRMIRGEHGFWTLSQLKHTNTCQQNLEKQPPWLMNVFGPKWYYHLLPRL